MKLNDLKVLCENDSVAMKIIKKTEMFNRIYKLTMGTILVFIGCLFTCGVYNTYMEYGGFNFFVSVGFLIISCFVLIISTYMLLDFMLEKLKLNENEISYINDLLDSLGKVFNTSVIHKNNGTYFVYNERLFETRSTDDSIAIKEVCNIDKYGDFEKCIVVLGTNERFTL